MKLLIAFFKDKTREISLYAGTVGIFIVVAFLYNIRMDALKYALLLVILWLLLYVITEYHRFRKKHLLLERFKKSAGVHKRTSRVQESSGTGLSGITGDL